LDFIYGLFYGLDLMGFVDAVDDALWAYWDVVALLADV
jgi:hypothetical protein